MSQVRVIGQIVLIFGNDGRYLFVDYAHGMWSAFVVSWCPAIFHLHGTKKVAFSSLLETPLFVLFPSQIFGTTVESRFCVLSQKQPAGVIEPSTHSGAAWGEIGASLGNVR